MICFGKIDRPYIYTLSISNYLYLSWENYQKFSSILVYLVESHFEKNYQSSFQKFKYAFKKKKKRCGSLVINWLKVLGFNIYFLPSSFLFLFLANHSYSHGFYSYVKIKRKYNNLSSRFSQEVCLTREIGRVVAVLTRKG